MSIDTPDDTPEIIDAMLPVDSENERLSQLSIYGQFSSQMKTHGIDESFLQKGISTEILKEILAGGLKKNPCFDRTGFEKDNDGGYDKETFDRACI